MLKERGVTEIQLKNKIDMYIRDPKNKIDQSPANRSAVKGNLFRQLTADSFTLKVYNTGMKILR